ncbi:hypothetical protein [Roseixanthobacter pseudopolyaromaticivorans]|uniref:hypothetical protein n=1 Tax=Xanthobacteraceae TaxID=335928 RepID=UPI00372800C5
MTDTHTIYPQPHDSNLIDHRMVPVYCETARELLSKGALTSAAKAEEVLGLLAREGHSGPEAVVILDIAFAIARQVNQTLLATSAPYGSTMRAEKKFNGTSAPEYVAEMIAASQQQNSEAGADSIIH